VSSVQSDSQRETARCPACGAARTANAPRGLCPRCLLRQGLEGSFGDLTGPPSDRAAGPIPWEPEDPSVLARFAEFIGGIACVRLRDPAAEIEPGPLVEPASAEMPPTGERPGRYQLFGEIARGGMGAVLRGRDVDLGRELAVKVLLRSHQDRPELVRRFIEEAQIGGQLQHPGVVPIYELGALADCRPFFTMKLVQGRTLAALLRARSSPGEELPRLLSIFESICQTVAYAHARGVIHRDLKPSNVMVGNFGEVQVMDWGLAKVLRQGGDDRDQPAPQADREAVGDAVRTARSGSGAEASKTGSILGTPGYMAPEQARGEVEAVDERADVFGLGAILCEILTGEPAFTGRDSAETTQKAIVGDLGEAFARLNGCGAEPELIALAETCLAADREDRPRQAGAVAERIAAYRASVQERIRQAELARVAADARAEEQAQRRALADELARQAEARADGERRRRRLTAALAAVMIAALMAAGGGLALIEQQRQEQARRVDLALGETKFRLAEAEESPDDPTRWRAAVDAAHVLEGIAADARDEPTRRQIARLVQEVRSSVGAAAADQRLLNSAVDIRSARADDHDGSVSDAAYAAAFREAGYDVDTIGPEVAADRIRSRPAGVALALAVALDDWAGERRRSRPGDAAWKRLVAAARAADPDPNRARLRALWSEPPGPARRELLEKLARDVDPRGWPPASLTLLAGALSEAGARDDAVALLQRAQFVHPGDVWINYDLGRALEALHPSRGEAAIGFFTAARALRPETAHELAHALDTRGRGAEARAIFEDLTRRRPANGHHWACLGQSRLLAGDWAGSLAANEKAVATLRAAIRRNPGESHTHFDLGLSLEYLGKRSEAVAEYRASIRLQPDSAFAHNSLGVVLRDQSKLAEAIAELREAIRLKPDFAAPHHNLGMALRDQGKSEVAIAEFREAIRLDGELVGEAPFALGDTLRRLGRYGEAIDHYRRLREQVQDNPRLRPRAAAALADAEREAALARRLPAVIRGEEKPKDAAEGLQFARLADHARRFGPSARLYAEAFRIDPGLAEDMGAWNRYLAACSAAMAGAGKGSEDPPLDGPARARWRQRALDWIRADLTFGKNLFPTDQPGVKEVVNLRLRRWKAEPDLAGVRDEEALNELPQAERRAWRDFWAEVDALIEATESRSPEGG
jgi:serine/threonine-protein kinase